MGIDVYQRAFGVALAALLLSTCSHSPTVPTESATCPAGFISTGSLTAQVDGMAWTASCVPPAQNGVQFGYISVEARDGSRQMFFQVRAGGVRDLLGAVPLTVGTYQIGGPAKVYGGDSYVIWDNVCVQPLQGPCPLWEAREELGTGTVTITTLTDQSATGTFTFGLVPVSGTGATGAVAVTNGKFSVTF
jgi:hypothetical protein